MQADSKKRIHIQSVPVGKKIWLDAQENLNRWKRVRSDDAGDEPNKDMYQRVFTDERLAELGAKTGIVYPKWGSRIPGESKGVYGGFDGKEWVSIGLRFAENLQTFERGVKGKHTRTRDARNGNFMPQVICMFNDPAIYYYYRYGDHSTTAGSSRSKSGIGKMTKEESEKIERAGIDDRPRRTVLSEMEKIRKGETWELHHAVRNLPAAKKCERRFKKNWNDVLIEPLFFELPVLDDLRLGPDVDFVPSDRSEIIPSMTIALTDRSADYNPVKDPDHDKKLKERDEETQRLIEVCLKVNALWKGPSW